MIVYLSEETKPFYSGRNQISGCLKHVVGEWNRRVTEMVTKELFGVLVITNGYMHMSKVIDLYTQNK